MDLKELLTITEVAQITACSVATVRRRIAAKDLRAVKHGRIVRIDPADLAAFLKTKKRWH